MIDAGTNLSFQLVVFGVVEDRTFQLHDVRPGISSLLQDSFRSSEVYDARSKNGEIAVFEAPVCFLEMDTAHVLNHLLKISQTVHLPIVIVDIGGVEVDAHIWVADASDGFEHVSCILAQVGVGLHGEEDLV